MPKRELWGLIYWGLIWFGVGFLPAELTGEEGLAPWPTLSATIQYLVHHHWLAGVAVLGVLLALAVHFLFDQKLWPSLFFGLTVALSAHFLNNRWP